MAHIGIDASRAITTQRTGTEAYAAQLIRALVPRAVARGHRVTLYTRQAPPEPLAAVPHAVRVLRLPRLWTHVALAAELHRRPPDLFFTPAHVIPVSYRGPSVATVHDLGYAFFPAAHPTRQRAYLRWSTRHNARRARHVLADSRATRRDLCQLVRIPEDKVTVVYPGLDPALQPLHDPARLATLGVRAPFLLTLGTLQPRKNIVRLLDAFTRIAERMPHQLVLAGKMGWLSDEIEAALETMAPAVRERVVVTGYVDDQVKAALLTAADLLVFVSLYEGFGFPVLEAQRCGTAVLCANTSSLPEVAGDAAALVDPTDTGAIAAAMASLAADPARRAALAAAGARNVGRFTWDAAADDALTVFEQVMESA